MGSSNKLKLSRLLLASAILLIVAFQSYWLKKLYQEEWTSLKKDTNGILRDVVYEIQATRYKNAYKTDSIFTSQGKSKPVNNLFDMTVVNELAKGVARKKEVDSLKKDSLRKRFKETVSVTTGTAYSSGDGRIEVHGDGLSPELLEMIGKRNVGAIAFSNVKLPPMMDSASLRRLSQSGMRVMISKNHSDTTGVSVENITIPSSATTPGLLVNRKFVNKSAPRPRITADNVMLREALPGDPSFVKFVFNGKPLIDSLSIPQLDSAYKRELTKAGIKLNFAIKKGIYDSLHMRDTMNAAKLVTSPRPVGLFPKYWYQAVFDSPTSFLLKKISLQILFSVFLVAFISLAFMFLYRNLLAQRKLTEMKNDFISNITHELKTPLATVSVAVEALRNFGGIQNPERTKEYLDISASELQRLSLLVDKVLKLSLFENRELELKKEVFDLRQLTEEVLNTMKLQFNTHHAKIDFEVQGNYFSVMADRLHITSVIFNLLDNALKYSKGKPEIKIRLRHLIDNIELQVEDNGIGISNDYKTKIFDKFFRVPHGDHHNIKGYGLGLSYVAHVIKRHEGTISVESEPGKGSTFTVKLPVT